MSSEESDAEILRQAWDVRTRDLIDARVGLAQAVAGLTGELGARRAELEAARAEIGALREHVERDRGALLELSARLEGAHADLARCNGELERLGRRAGPRYADTVRRLLARVRARGR